MKRRRTTPKILHRAKELRQLQTPEEARLWERLRNRQLAGIKFRRQHALGNLILMVFSKSPDKSAGLERECHEHLHLRQVQV